MESVQQCHKIRHEQSSGGRLLSPAPPRRAGKTRATCQGIVDVAFASPAAHKRMTGKYMHDVFGGSGFLTRASNHLGLRGYVLDTKFGPRYAVCLVVVERVGNPDCCGATSHGLGQEHSGVVGSPCRKRTLFPVGNVDNRDAHRIARKCAGTGGRCSVTGQKHVHPKAASRVLLLT